VALLFKVPFTFPELVDALKVPDSCVVLVVVA